ncbi:MAG: DASH family cryptochrome [Saprospiraceae bacterium]|nr:DASH family cryptochrome [Saprospiraceae bacterium]MBK6814479.1 DASH family cryptochrome [Saprospiraceae bacterium]MBK7608694.1 DASH family cryptochrome [Saprospiraceae bacterium]MBK8278943.1 DASH family cryptochrome [Saprospiraceae bacterium]MBK9678721.1 DASH family cryptochrome [Saprospiraceae bacterium]
MKNKSILWFRQDLRIHDNEALYEAIKWNSEVIPVYVFDPRVFQSISRFGHRRMSGIRARFIIESVHELRAKWREMGSDLIVRVGHPEEIIFQLAKQFKTSLVFCNRERTRDEVYAQDTLEKNLWTVGQEMRYARGKMLYYTQDLPFPVTHTPDNFSTFRKEFERIIPVRPALAIPDFVSPMMHPYDPGEIPDLKSFDLVPCTEDQVYHFAGGELAGLRRLKEYVWAGVGLRKYRAKDRSISDPFFTTMLSPWLSQGCVSPKVVYHEIKSYESINGTNENIQALLTELIRRDYCRLIAKKYGNKVFLKGGITGKVSESRKDESYLFNLWKEGRLGIPILDAGMKALSATGYLPFPLRNACAQFLVHTLKLNWQLGADWYESNLIDYDPASNWVNWLVLAGLLPDSAEDKPLSINFLTKKYDPQGKFVRHWIHALDKVPDIKIFHPELMDLEEQKKYDFIPGKHYPKPIVTYN